MKSYIIAALVASSTAVKLNWPSVARCDGSHISSDHDACDHNNNMEHAHDNTALQIVESWPSVARCDGSHTSSDHDACDHNNNMPHAHDDTTIQTSSQWPSVARCQPGHTSSDHDACDHNNNMEHAHDDTTLQLSFRPAIKCKDPIHGNPISCDHDDINESNWNDLPKDDKGITPVKEVVGGPLVDNDAALEEEKAKKAGF
eukprot:CAMPEP_0170493570 /NCGR_PEP_ID=MMETSP0208-20121228/14117_1 /TAXON_ID=197538 /ORGANISM="Strombidium inclinatum, Strain S3" /LENGTH=200 /DNA_ID=CAMNT_0010769517 /DNA_START=1 /DNA_END=603 /DNA_ORIENTATION=+